MNFRRASLTSFFLLLALIDDDSVWGKIVLVFA